MQAEQIAKTLGKPVTCNGMPAYEGPLSAAQRQWIGLTDEQINHYDYEYRDILYDVEKMLKENNA